MWLCCNVIYWKSLDWRQQLLWGLYFSDFVAVFCQKYLYVNFTNVNLIQYTSVLCKQTSHHLYSAQKTFSVLFQSLCSTVTDLKKNLNLENVSCWVRVFPSFLLSSVDVMENDLYHSDLHDMQIYICLMCSVCALVRCRRCKSTFW